MDKIGAVDWTPLAGTMGSTAHTVLMNWSAIKGALEQIKQGKIPAMHVRLLDVAQNLSTALASIQEACQNDIFEFHCLENDAPETRIAEIVTERKKAESMYDATVKALAFFSSVSPLIAEQLIDYSPQQDLQKAKGNAVGV
ncbi:MAG: hypothetical protein ABSF34_17600 [Verrucomicrobiota bacterium]